MRLRDIASYLSKTTLALLIVSVALNVALARTVSDLRLTVNKVKSETRLMAGDKLAPALVLRDGVATTISFTDTKLPTVLYVMRPTCSWCVRNNDNLAAITEQAPGRYRLVVVSIEEAGIEEYRNKYRIKAPIDIASAEMRQSYRLGGTPQTLLIASDGSLLENWMGAYTGDLKNVVERKLGLTLPGAPSSVSQPK